MGGVIAWRQGVQPPSPRTASLPRSLSSRGNEGTGQKGVNASGTSGHPAVPSPPSTVRGLYASGQWPGSWLYRGAEGGRRGEESSPQPLNAPEEGEMV